jgi:hypothetical protein
MTPLARVLAILPLLAGCLGPADDTYYEEGELPVLPGQEPSLLSPEDEAAKSAILDRMRARLPEVRALKADLSIGESHEALLAEPPVASPQMGEPTYAERARAIVAAENADRNAFYDLEMKRYEADVRRQIQQQLPEIERQVREQLCAQLPWYVPCDSIATETVTKALGPAIEAAVVQALIPVRAAVVKLYAGFWQAKATQPGEWIEVTLEAGVHEWRAKPEPALAPAQ